MTTHKRTLLVHHRRELHASGLTDKTIDKCGFYSEAGYAALATILDWRKVPKKMAPALVIPFTGPDGRNGYCRIKPDTPRLRNGKPIKYESPQGQANQIYIPPGTSCVLDDPTVELTITEGEKKAAKCDQDICCCIGLGGVYGWKDSRAERMLPALERIAWQGRTVYLCFDSDIVDKPEVQDAEARLAHQLTIRGANVRSVRIPASADGAKVGLDDFLVANPSGEFRKLLDSAEDPPGVEGIQTLAHAKHADPATEARAILDASKIEGHYRLRFWRDQLHWWNRGRFIERTDSEIRAIVANHLNRSFCSVGQGVISNVIEQIRAHSILSAQIEQPKWLDDVPGSEWNTRDLLFCRDAIIHLPSLFTCENCRIDATPAMFSSAALDFDFARECDPPKRWLQFLAELWPDDQECIDAVQLWFGYILTPDTSQQKMLGLFGPKRSGKSTIARIAKGLVGDANTAAPTLTSFATQFGLSPLVNKTLAVVADARFSGRLDAAAVVERLLRITGEDPVDVDRKHLPFLTCKLPSRIMIISNELPRLNDASGALVSRMIVLPLQNSFYGAEDTRLTDELLAERPSILWWAIEGWRRLQDRGTLLQPASGAELIGELEMLSSPVTVFVRECCQTGADFRISRKDLYDTYKIWCEEHGRQHIEDEAGFGRNLRAAVPRLRSERRRMGGHLTRFYVGIQLGAPGVPCDPG